MSKCNICGDERLDHFLNQFCNKCVSDRMLETNSFKPINNQSDIEILLERIINIEANISALEMKIKDFKDDLK